MWFTAKYELSVKASLTLHLQGDATGDSALLANLLDFLKVLLNTSFLHFAVRTVIG